MNIFLRFDYSDLGILFVIFSVVIFTLEDQKLYYENFTSFVWKAFLLFFSALANLLTPNSV